MSPPTTAVAADDGQVLACHVGLLWSVVIPQQPVRWARRRRTPTRRRSARRTDAPGSRRSATRCVGSRSGWGRRPAPARAPAGSGSPDTTSRQAPARRPSDQRRHSASVSRISPRAVLTRIAARPISASRRASSSTGSPRSEPRSPRSRRTRPAACRACTCSTPGRRTLRRDQPRTRIPTALPSAATRRPIRPSPITPRVLPASSAP